VGVIVLAVRVIVSGVALKCLPFNGLGLFRLISRRKVLRGRVLRIVDCVAFCCVIQVISLSGAAVDAERRGKNGDFRHVPQTISLRDVEEGVKWERGTVLWDSTE